jgi:EAL domain-containing protein (putative c-di-GMP-specific phosphodiesterase class I)
MEALLRWHAPDRVIPPWEFIPLAEETGLILPLGEWVFREVCRQVSQWASEGHPPPEVAVNLSARQLHQEGLPAFLKGVMDEYAVDPSRIGVEITESGIMEDLVDSVSVLSGIKDLGMTVYVDDFGTGYSSLNYLKRLPIDVLKIDMSSSTACSPTGMTRPSPGPSSFWVVPWACRCWRRGWRRGSSLISSGRTDVMESRATC